MTQMTGPSKEFMIEALSTKFGPTKKIMDFCPKTTEELETFRKYVLKSWLEESDKLVIELQLKDKEIKCLKCEICALKQKRLPLKRKISES